jgi:hypothetical protein
MEQDFEKVNYYLDLAASHYGYGTFDIFSTADLYEKEEKAEKIMRLAELIQNEVHKSEKELLSRMSVKDNRFMKSILILMLFVFLVIIAVSLFRSF